MSLEVLVVDDTDASHHGVVGAGLLALLPRERAP